MALPQTGNSHDQIVEVRYNSLNSHMETIALGVWMIAHHPGTPPLLLCREKAGHSAHDNAQASQLRSPGWGTNHEEELTIKKKIHDMCARSNESDSMNKPTIPNLNKLCIYNIRKCKKIIALLK